MNLDHVTQAVERQLSGMQRRAGAAELRRSGPLVDVTLHPECEPSAPCAPVTGKALIDTGADRTAVEFTALPEQAKVDGFYNAQGVTSEAISLPVYRLGMSFPGTDLGRVNIEKAAATPHLRSQGLIALLGRDVLSQAQLSYDGPSGAFSMSTPSGETSVTSSTKGPFMMAAISAAIGAAAGAATAIFLAGGDGPKTAGGPEASFAESAQVPVAVGVVAAVLALMFYGAKREAAAEPRDRTPDLLREGQRVRLNAVTGATPSGAAPTDATPSGATSSGEVPS